MKNCKHVYPLLVVLTSAGIGALARHLPDPLVGLDPMRPPPMGGGTLSGGAQPISPNGTTKPNRGGSGSESMQRPSTGGISGPALYEGNSRHDSMSPAGALS